MDEEMMRKTSTTGDPREDSQRQMHGLLGDPGAKRDASYRVMRSQSDVDREHIIRLLESIDETLKDIKDKMVSKA